MRKMIKGTAVLLLAAALPSVAIAATGTPQRSSETPPGLAKVLLTGNPGILRALIATQGSNSRLQEIPVSP